MNKFKLEETGITLGSPLRVLLAEDNGDQDTLPFAKCDLYAVMHDRNLPFTDFEIHYYCGMQNEFDRGDIELQFGKYEFSASSLIDAYNEKNYKNVADHLPQFLEDIAVGVQKQILYGLDEADLLTDIEHGYYVEWTKVYTKPLMRLEEPSELSEQQNYIMGTYLTAQVALDMVEGVLRKILEVPKV